MVHSGYMRSSPLCYHGEMNVKQGCRASRRAPVALCEYATLFVLGRTILSHKVTCMHFYVWLAPEGYHRFRTQALMHVCGVLLVACGWST